MNRIALHPHNRIAHSTAHSPSFENRRLSLNIRVEGTKAL
jgi:hypothetical protein